MTGRARRSLIAGGVLAAVLVTVLALRLMWAASSGTAGTASDDTSGGTTLTGGTAHDVVTLTISDPVTGMTDVDVTLTPREGGSACGSTTTVTVSALLPTAGHALPDYPATSTATGTYHVSGIALMMPGRWEFTVGIDGDDCHDQLVFPLTVTR